MALQQKLTKVVTSKLTLLMVAITAVAAFEAVTAVTVIQEVIYFQALLMPLILPYLWHVIQVILFQLAFTTGLSSLA